MPEIKNFHKGQNARFQGFKVSSSRTSREKPRLTLKPYSLETSFTPPSTNPASVPGYLLSMIPAAPEQVAQCQPAYCAPLPPHVRGRVYVQLRKFPSRD